MKYVLSFLLVFPFLCFGQIHIKNQRFLQMNVGIYDSVEPSLDNYIVSAEIGKYGKRLNAHTFGFLYGHKLAANKVPVDRFEGFAKVEKNLFSNANLTRSFKILGMFNLGYESLNKEKTTFNNEELVHKSSFIFGLSTGAEYELSPIVVGVRTTYNFTSDYQKFTTYPYIGFKIHFQ